MSIKSELTGIIKNEVERLGYEFVDLKYGRGGRKWFLQVFCDKPGGLALNDCEKISRELGYELDRHGELLKHSYNLEVSSPGLDRPLKSEDDFKKHMGQDIIIKLFDPGGEARVRKGTLQGIEGEKIFIKEAGGKKKEFDLKNIASAKLEVKI